VQTVGGELVGRYVFAQFAGLGAFNEQVADEVAQLVFDLPRGIRIVDLSLLGG